MSRANADLEINGQHLCPGCRLGQSMAGEGREATFQSLILLGERESNIGHSGPALPLPWLGDG